MFAHQAYAYVQSLRSRGLAHTRHKKKKKSHLFPCPEYILEGTPLYGYGNFKDIFMSGLFFSPWYFQKTPTLLDPRMGNLYKVCKPVSSSS